MQNVVERRTETKVLEICAITLEVLCDEDHAIYSRCDVVRSTLIDRLFNQLREVLDSHVALIDSVSVLTHSFSRFIEININIFLG